MECKCNQRITKRIWNGWLSSLYHYSTLPHPPYLQSPFLNPPTLNPQPLSLPIIWFFIIFKFLTFSPPIKPSSFVYSTATAHGGGVCLQHSPWLVVGELNNLNWAIKKGSNLLLLSSLSFPSPDPWGVLHCLSCHEHHHKLHPFEKQWVPPTKKILITLEIGLNLLPSILFSSIPFHRIKKYCHQSQWKFSSALHHTLVIFIYFFYFLFLVFETCGPRIGFLD